MMVNECYRLLKYAKAKRILFLVDRRNLADQALREFTSFECPDEQGRLFSELYNIQLLGSRHVDEVSNVCVSTIQRVYSI